MAWIKNKKIIFLVILLILSGLIAIKEFRRQSLEETARKVPRIFDFKNEDLSQVFLKMDNSKILIKKTDGKWTITDSDNRVVRADYMRDLLAVYDFGVVQDVESNPNDYGIYGLSSPAIELGILLKDKNKFDIIYIGDDNPPKTSCYAMVKEKQEIILLGIGYKRTIKHFFNKFKK